MWHGIEAVVAIYLGYFRRQMTVEIIIAELHCLSNGGHRVDCSASYVHDGSGCTKWDRRDGLTKNKANALHFPAPEQKMFRDRTEPTLFRAGTVPETVPVRSLKKSTVNPNIWHPIDQPHIGLSPLKLWSASLCRGLSGMLRIISYFWLDSCHTAKATQLRLMLCMYNGLLWAADSRLVTTIVRLLYLSLASDTVDHSL